MKKIFLTVAVITAAVAFYACETTDKIEVPKGSIVIDLGDSAAAMKGVNVTSKDGKVTDGITFDGLNQVGKQGITIKYGTASEHRDATVKASKLEGSYNVTGGAVGTVTLDAEPVANELTRIRIKGINNLPSYLEFEGDGPNKLQMIEKLFEDGAKLNGHILYGKTGADFHLVRAELTMTESDGTAENLVFVFER